MAVRMQMRGWIAVLVLWGCSSTPLAQDRPKDTPVVGSGLFEPDFWKKGRGLRWQAETAIRVQGEEPRVIEDFRQLDRTPEGNYRVFVRRRGPTPSGETTEETFTAIVVGRDLWTRGSGGPFVLWEDPAPAIREFERMAFEGTQDLWRIASACGTERPEGERERWVLEKAPCVHPAVGDGPGRLERLELVVDRPEGALRSLTAQVSWTVPTEGGPVTVSMEHRVRLDDLPLGSEPRPPEGALTARRERPVRMVQRVLSGLGEWGPGAPWRDGAQGATGDP